MERGKPVLPLDAVERRLKTIVGAVHALNTIGSGQDSQAFAFRSAGEEYILRLHADDTGFRKDALASRYFAEPSLPIPKVIRIGPWSNDHFFCITSRLPGRTLQDLEGGELQRTLPGTAAMLQRISIVALPSHLTDYGPFDEDGTGRYGSWRDWLRSVADPYQTDWSAVSGVVRAESVQPLLVRMASMANRCPEERKLVHGDFGSNNVLAYGDSISGVLDWSEAAIGDPAYDLANIFFWRTWLHCMHEQAAWFEETGTIDEGLRERLIAYGLHIGLREVYESARNGKKVAAQWALHRCHELLSHSDGAQTLRIDV